MSKKRIFNLTWEIEVEAESPEEAAHDAWCHLESDGYDIQDLGPTCPKCGNKMDYRGRKVGSSACIYTCPIKGCDGRIDEE